MQANIAYDSVEMSTIGAIYDVPEQIDVKKTKSASANQEKRKIKFRCFDLLTVLALALAALAVVLVVIRLTLKTETDSFVQNIRAILSQLNNSAMDQAIHLDQRLNIIRTEQDQVLDTINNLTHRFDSFTALPSETCGGLGWRRVTFIDMINPNQDCPEGLNLTDYSIRSCGRAHTGFFNCSSVTFPVDSEYSQVCGRATGYQWGYSAGFWGYHENEQTIDGTYVDGLSLTHGSPRTHIWTFASGLFNGTSEDVLPQFRCPCDHGNSTFSSPPFVGNDYFCESVRTVDDFGDFFHLGFFPDNALWDGQDNLNPCYGLNNPPWFNKTLPVPTTDDIELRMCFIDGSFNSNFGIDLLELYIY